MPVDDKRIRLRSVLAGKSTEDLEELLALSFSMEDGAETDEAYIMTIMEVIREREEKEADQEKRQAEVDAAWREFQEYRAERDREKTEADGMADASGKFPGEPSRPQEKVHTAKKPGRVLRSCAAAAAVIVLLCGTAYAFGWNIFQALADWTAETFQFLSGAEPEMADHGVFENLYRIVSAETDVSTVPRWAPEGTEETEQPRMSMRSDRTRVIGNYTLNGKEFTVRITIYDSSDLIEYTGTYQKDEAFVEKYETADIIHYIASNLENTSAMWTNENVEGHIQGNISIEDVKQIIDSIYEE